MRMAGTLARTRVSSVMRPAVVLRHVQVGADEDPFASHATLCNQVRQTKHVHDGLSEV
jgi:hypothetical protein